MNTLFLVLSIMSATALRGQYRAFAVVLSLAMLDVVFFKSQGVASLYQHLLLDSIILSFAFYLRIDKHSKIIILTLIASHLVCLASYKLSFLYSLIATLYPIATTISFAALLVNIFIKSSSIKHYRAHKPARAERSFYPKEIINELEHRRL